MQCPLAVSLHISAYWLTSVDCSAPYAVMRPFACTVTMTNASHVLAGSLRVTSAVAICLTLTCMPCSGVGYKSDFMTYCTNKLYGLMFARELATRLKARPLPPSSPLPHHTPQPRPACPRVYTLAKYVCHKCCPHHMVYGFMCGWQYIMQTTLCTCTMEISPALLHFCGVQVAPLLVP